MKIMIFGEMEYRATIKNKESRSVRNRLEAPSYRNRENFKSTKDIFQILLYRFLYFFILFQHKVETEYKSSSLQHLVVT